MDKQIGEVIKSIREYRKLSIQDIAYHSGVSRPFISQVESGKKQPSAKVLAKIADSLRVSKLYLFKEAGYLDETDILSLVDENKRLREALENAQSEIIPIRGYERGDVDSITSVCIKIRKVLEGDDWD